MKLFVTHGGAHSTYEAVHHGLVGRAAFELGATPGREHCCA